MASKRIAPAKTPTKTVVVRQPPAPSKKRVAPRSPAPKALRLAGEAVVANRQTSVRFYLADDMRAEVGGKVTAVGLYTDNVVVAEMSPDAPEPTVNQPAVIGGISVLACVATSAGEHKYQLRIDPSSAVIQFAPKPPSVVSTPSEGASINLIMRFAQLPFTRFGVVNLELLVDDEPHPFSFELRRRNLP